MGPYRPLHVVDNPVEAESGARRDHRQLVALCVVLALARVAPSFYAAEAVPGGATIALLTLGGGLALVFRSPRLRRRR